MNQHDDFKISLFSVRFIMLATLDNDFASCATINKTKTKTQ